MEENIMQQVSKAIDIVEALKVTRRRAEDEYNESLARIGNGDFGLMECAIAERKVMEIVDTILVNNSANGYFGRLKDIIVQ